jgi:serine/threonine protein kinase
MAPEIVDMTGEGKGYSYKADVWSAGCTVAEMITGKPPWPQRPNAPAALFMIANAQGPPSEMPTAADGATAECEDFLLRCFTRNPDDRPTAEALLQHPWITGKSEQR